VDEFGASCRSSILGERERNRYLKSLREIPREIVTQLRHESKAACDVPLPQGCLKGLVGLSEMVFLAYQEPRTDAATTPWRNRKLAHVSRKRRTNRDRALDVHRLAPERQLEGETTSSRESTEQDGVLVPSQAVARRLDRLGDVRRRVFGVPPNRSESDQTCPAGTIGCTPGSTRSLTSREVVGIRGGLPGWKSP
jgi:hypothetical protein